MIAAVEQLGQTIGVAAACRSLPVSRSQVYRARQPKPSSASRVVSGRALSAEERVQVRDVLNSERFQDLAPRQVYAKLLDDGRYLCHWRTMYRILADHQEMCERRRQRRHVTYAKPELLATAPNQVWSWDITQLKGPVKWYYFYLYVILDVFSRYVVGWTIQHRESAGCVFRRSGPPIPNEVRPLFRAEVGQRFRSMWATHSGACGPPPSERSDAGVEVRPEPSRRACLGWPSCVA